MATHSSVLAWRIPGTREPGGLPSLGSHRVGHDWNDLAAAASISQIKSNRRREWINGTLGKNVYLSFTFCNILKTSYSPQPKNWKPKGNIFSPKDLQSVAQPGLAVLSTASNCFFFFFLLNSIDLSTWMSTVLLDVKWLQIVYSTCLFVIAIYNSRGDSGGKKKRRTTLCCKM